jgi:hypothetical protein
MVMALTLMQVKVPHWLLKQLKQLMQQMPLEQGAVQAHVATYHH